MSNFGDPGHYTDITLDSSDRPHISYVQSQFERVRYAYWDGGTWQADTVGYALNSVDNLVDTAIAIDSAGTPHVAYTHERWLSDPTFASLATNINYAVWDGNDWKIQTFYEAGRRGGDVDLVLDSSDLLHMSFYDWNNGDLMSISQAVLKNSVYLPITVAK